MQCRRFRPQGLNIERSRCCAATVGEPASHSEVSPLPKRGIDFPGFSRIGRKQVESVSLAIFSTKSSSSRRYKKRPVHGSQKLRSSLLPAAPSDLAGCRHHPHLNHVEKSHILKRGRLQKYFQLDVSYGREACARSLKHALLPTFRRHAADVCDPSTPMSDRHRRSGVMIRALRQTRPTLPCTDRGKVTAATLLSSCYGASPRSSR
ncbi:hypothetical protein BD626DRAFT_170006 [Schizophyllum amplum]|uniref:Uncharacterized protein n=1 Tax=Schizophyllum amplum TaxID=97359 RepID=A0A550CQT9_9AGAR|nr:hypothetical protein BD626DRAFT_170006 [Auriculariopsis ampla]